MKPFWQALRLFLLLTLLTGIIYPLIITGIAQLTMYEKAQGSLVSYRGKIVGSKLIAQKFEDERNFWPRPSFIDYNPLPSGASNYGATSLALQHEVINRRELLLRKHSMTGNTTVPPELLFASGSGLDPHLSEDGVVFQLERVLQARAIGNNETREAILKLINSATQYPVMGIIGRPYVNILLVNAALDDIESKNGK